MTRPRVGRPTAARLTTADVAERLGTPVRTVQDWIARGELVVVNLGSAKRPRWRLTEEAVADFIEARTHRAGRSA